MKTNSLRAWLLASRPKTLAGAAAPVLVGGALAAHQLFADIAANGALDTGRYAALPAVSAAFALCLVFALVMQVCANFVNDYFDFSKGADRADRLGPERACASGWVTPRAMRRAIAASAAAGCLAGLPLVAFGGWKMLAVGALCVAAAVFYTTHLSYLGLGDVLVVVFFGVVPVVFTYWCMVGEANTILLLDAALYGLAVGLATDCLLMVNNCRDVEQDRASGKRTLVVRFGLRAGQLAYLWLGIAATIIAAVVMPGGAPSMLVYLLLHVLAFRKLQAHSGRDLNRVLGSTARNILVFGLLLAVFLYFT